MQDKVYRFADFELTADDGELRSKSATLRLQDKPLLLLCTLLDHPQALVTRQQLRERMWASDTFVDYEQGINVAIKKVRDALGDSAENPKFIQTVAKKGYRFLVPVQVIGPVKISVPSSTPQESAPETQRITEHRAVRRSWIYATIAAAILLAASVWLYRIETVRARHSTQIRSLAVLPLRDLSPQPGQEYFADGVTEDVITNLAQSLPLRVISRTSVMRYKQTSEPITQIAQELGVEAIVEGAVARSGNRVTVTVQLIDVTEDRHLWAQKYDRDLKNVLDIETELSQEIATRVGTTLTAQHAVDALKSRPVDPQVYELCLLGRYHWNKRTAADLAKSADYYWQAIARDPNYAPAYAGLANAYALRVVYDNVPVQETFAKARAAALRALELDNTLAEPHAALGIIALNVRDWKPSGPELRRAIDLNPNYATAHHWLAFYLAFSDQTEQALAEIEKARQLDPLSAVINADEGHFLYTARKFEEARIRLRQAIELNPDFDQPHETLALINVESGNPEEAVKEARAGVERSSSNARTLGEAGYVLAVTGHVEEANKLLSDLKSMSGNGAPEPVFEALIEVGLNDHHAAMQSLEEDGRVFGLIGLSQWHAFDEISREPRIQQLIAEVR